MLEIVRVEFHEELFNRGTNGFFEEAYVVHLWVVNSLTALRTVMRRNKTAYRHTRKELKSAVAQAEKAEAELEAARAERAELEEARSWVAAGLERARLAEEELEAARAAINDRDLRLDSLTFEVKSAILRAVSVEEAARQADVCAAEWKVAAQTVGEKAVAAEGKAIVADASALLAEERAAVAEARVVTVGREAKEAVNDFRKSEAFEEEVVDASVDAYLQG